MNILLCDTSRKTLSVLLSKGEEVFTSFSSENYSHSQTLFVEIEKLLESANISKDEIDVVGTITGPGSFTGIRIGVVFAKGLCYAKQTKIVSCNAFEAVAREGGHLLPAGILLEERLGGGYFAIAKVQNGNVEISSAGVKTKEEIAVLLEENGIDRILSNSKIPSATDIVDGICGFLEIAKEKIANGEFDDLNELEPFYLKASSAVELKKQF